jgi:hypothetical protein
VKSLPSQEDLKGAAKALTRKLDAALNESNAPPPPELLAELDAVGVGQQALVVGVALVVAWPGRRS